MAATPTIIHAMNDHAKDKAEIINALGVVFTTVLRPRGWDVKHLGKGAGSWMFFNPATGEQAHFRNGGRGCVRVMDHWYAVALRRPQVFLRSRLDVIRWAEARA